MTVIHKGPIEQYIIFELLNHLTIIVTGGKQMTMHSKIHNIFDKVFNHLLKRTQVKRLVSPNFFFLFCFIFIFDGFL